MEKKNHLRIWAAQRRSNPIIHILNQICDLWRRIFTEINKHCKELWITLPFPSSFINFLSININFSFLSFQSAVSFPDCNLRWKWFVCEPSWVRLHDEYNGESANWHYDAWSGIHSYQKLKTLIKHWTKKAKWKIMKKQRQSISHPSSAPLNQSRLQASEAKKNQSQTSLDEKSSCHSLSAPFNEKSTRNNDCKICIFGIMLLCFRSP